MGYFFKNIRSVVLFFCDLSIVALSYIFTNFICLYGADKTRGLYSFLVAVVIYSATFICFGMYKSIWRYAKAPEFILCVASSFMAGIIFTGIDLIMSGRDIKATFYIILIITVMLGVTVMRLMYRLYRQNYFSLSKEKKKKRAMFVGAGKAAMIMIDECTSNTYCDFIPVVMVDDDSAKVRRKMGGVPVDGMIKDIPELAEKYKVDLIIITIPSATNKERSYILDVCNKTECAVKALPLISDLGENDMRDMTSKLRDITTDELLGRDPILVANKDVYDFVSGKTVLVSGGGGSIGSELCRQIAAHSPKKLIIIDIYENNAYDIEQELKREYNGKLNLLVLIASIRDYDRLNAVFAAEKPEVVLHAAAHKHVPLMEDSPAEAVKNNVFGTFNMARAAMENHVKKFIMISTDKAVNPTNIMGATKRVCEMIVQSLNGKSSTVFAAVRFGNVLGSNGSVIPLFKKQIASGGPVTVTDPEIIRFFMTIPEAAQLVLTAGAMARGGEIFVLDMGAPVKIDDLAKKMIKMSGYTLGQNMKIEYTGLRPGEKLFEELLMDEEGIQTTGNEKIFVGKPIEIDSKELFEKLGVLRETVDEPSVSPEQVEAQMLGIVPTFTHCYNEKKEQEAEAEEMEALKPNSK